MSRKDSLNVFYKTIGKIRFIKTLLFYVIIVETLLSIWFSDSLVYKGFLIATVCLNFLIVVLFEVLNYIAEKKRIVNAVENGFQKDIDSNTDTDGYYNNSFKSGLGKFNLNVFESVFFTKRLFEKSIVLKYISYSVFVVVFIVSLSISVPSVCFVVCEIVFSCGVAQEFVRNILFHIEINRLFNQFDHVYVANGYHKQKEALLAYCFHYEKLKSYISLSLSDRTFKKMNDTLSKEWDEYCSKIKSK